MTEAALFYEAASSQLGTDFLDDVHEQLIFHESNYNAQF